MRVLDPTWIDPEFRLAKRTLDLTTTYDGCEVASNAFAEFCEAIPGIGFAPLPSEPDFVVVRIDQTVRIDSVANGTRIGERCHECEQPRFVVRPGALNFIDGEQLRPGLSRTDLGFGDTADFGSSQPNHLGGVIIANEETGLLLNAAEFRGVHAFPP